MKERQTKAAADGSSYAMKATGKRGGTFVSRPVPPVKKLSSAMSRPTTASLTPSSKAVAEVGALEDEVRARIAREELGEKGGEKRRRSPPSALVLR